MIIPQTILNHQEYQAKLQRLAMFADQGDNKKMQQILDNEQVIDQKNVLLQPIFRDLKSQIRHMSFSPEFELLREYLSKRQLLLNSTKGRLSDNEQEQLLSKLQ